MRPTSITTDILFDTPDILPPMNTAQERNKAYVGSIYRRRQILGRRWTTSPTVANRIEHLKALQNVRIQNQQGLAIGLPGKLPHESMEPFEVHISATPELQPAIPRNTIGIRGLYSPLIEETSEKELTRAKKLRAIEADILGYLTPKLSSPADTEEIVIHYGETYPGQTPKVHDHRIPVPLEYTCTPRQSSHSSSQTSLISTSNPPNEPVFQLQPRKESFKSPSKPSNHVSKTPRPVQTPEDAFLYDVQPYLVQHPLSSARPASPKWTPKFPPSKASTRSTRLSSNPPQPKMTLPYLKPTLSTRITTLRIHTLLLHCMMLDHKIHALTRSPWLLDAPQTLSTLYAKMLHLACTARSLAEQIECDALYARCWYWEGIGKAGGGGYDARDAFERARR